MIWPVEFGLARQLGNNDAAILIVGAPDDPVASDHGRQVGAQITAPDLSGMAALGGFDVHLDPEMGNDQARLLRPQVATDQALFGHVRPATGAYGTFVLDFLNTPVLASGEVSLGHVLH